MLKRYNIHDDKKLQDATDKFVDATDKARFMIQRFDNSKLLRFKDLCEAGEDLIETFLKQDYGLFDYDRLENITTELDEIAEKVVPEPKKRIGSVYPYLLGDVYNGILANHKMPIRNTLFGDSGVFVL